MLISLEPLAIGTAECESLSSYVQRLAAVHGCLPGQLVFRLLTWLDLNRREMVGQYQKRPGRVLIGKNNNSFSHADTWLRLLQKTTNRSDLVYLTTRHWDHLFPTRGFQRRCLAWCPLCLAGDAKPYHRLSWLLQPVHVCQRHHVRLRHECARCSRAIPIVHERSAITTCPRCGGDLRQGGALNDGPAVSEYQDWSAKEAEQIITRSASWHDPLSWTPAEALRALGEAKQITHASAFGQYIGTSRITAWYWLTGSARPSFPMALHAYHRFGASLAAALSGGRELSLTNPESQPELYLSGRKEKHHRDWDKVESQLRAELGKPDSEADSMLGIGARLGVDSRTLRAHFPKLCRKISRRRRKIIHDAAARKLAQLRSEIAAARDELVRQRCAVTQQAVALFLERPGLFCRSSAREIFRALVDTEIFDSHCR